MEGVTHVMPMAVKAGSVLNAALPYLAGNSGSGGVSEAAEARAAAVLAQAQRQAEAQREAAQDKADELREVGEKRRAKARVGAATSGLSLSGSSLLSLSSIDGQTDKDVTEVLGDAERAAGSLLTSAEEQARSIRLSGRVQHSRSGGLDSLLRLGGQSLGGLGLPTSLPTMDF